MMKKNLIRANYERIGEYTLYVPSISTEDNKNVRGGFISLSEQLQPEEFDLVAETIIKMTIMFGETYTNIKIKKLTKIFIDKVDINNSCQDYLSNIIDYINTDIN